ncbi:hypothetical protein TYRP_020155 [Tyrophagus putrescentiae]|nr:hypothetical protein TYRP_020155 [Tyrophagus putrescentiae]
MVLNALLDTDHPKELESLLKAHRSLFIEYLDEIGLIQTEKCCIRLSHDLPISLRPYRCTPEDQANIDQQIAELLEKNMIRVSTSPYSFPVVLVDKKDEGAKTRLCPRAFTMWRSKKRISIRPAFSTQNGHYEWNRMPFGLKNAPIIFQRMIAHLIQKHELSAFAINYIDDIIIFSTSFRGTSETLTKVFQMLTTENIRLKLKKCHFAQPEVIYLGYKISHNRVEPTRSNTEAIEKVPPPKDVKSLRGFLGKVNYYHRFIENRAVTLYPLYQLLKKNTKWEWDDDCQRAFDHVKAILTTSPVLRIFEPNHDTYLYTDASRKGIGAPATTVTELELLAVVSAIDYWHYYLIGKRFTVYTDHAPLKAVGKIGKPNTRLFNWAVKLKQYNFAVEYRPGPKNEEADYLSRNPIEQLYELTEHIAMWVDQERIKRAWEEMDPAEWKRLPRKVHIIEGKEGKQYIYRKGDLTKEFLPLELAKDVLKELHLNLGHAGPKTLELQFTIKYYTPYLVQLIRSVLDECDTCVRVKTPKLLYGTLGMVGPATAPFEIVHIDTKSGFRGLGSAKDNLHLAIDAFTRFAWGVSSKTKLAVDFIHLIQKVMTLQKPHLIFADNYPSIRGKAFRDFLAKHDIKIMFTAPNHPSSNGMVERLNQTLIVRVTCKRVERPHIAWTTQIQGTIEEYNASIHSVTKYTPLYLLTGLDPDHLFEGETLESSRAKAYANSVQHHLRNATYYNTNRFDPLSNRATNSSLLHNTR